MTMTSEDYERFVQKFYSAIMPFEGVEIRHRKTYMGKVSQRLIEVDLAFEMSVCRALLLVVIECKCYALKVDVSDVEEFHSKLDDIGAHKGIMVTTIGFQEGAILTPRGRGIALALLTTQPQEGELVMMANSRQVSSGLLPAATDNLLQGTLRDPLLSEHQTRFRDFSDLWAILHQDFAPFIDDQGAFHDPRGGC
jgi:hypothetical protein